ncbi:MAG: FAD:protein FMN transferase [Ignavibacteriaceae bacterium]|nr:FAD:protein FMN transferase [Ignavibacteriaceae bacterium]
MKKVLLYIGLFIAFFAIGYFIAGSSDNEPITVKRSQILLGTIVEIQVRTLDEVKANEAISNAFAEIKRIDDLFTSYHPKGEVYKINHVTDTLLVIGSELFKLMKISDSLWNISGGAFDVSLEALTHSWGFDGDNPSIPAKDSIEYAVEHSGWKNVKLLADNKILRKNKIMFNFGAITKGYAVDKAVDVLKQAGLNDALVNAGGEIKGVGSNWIVGVKHPRNQQALLTKLKLNGSAVATSGDYEQYFEVNGIRYHHIINPATGYPAQGLQSVTIVADNNRWADGVSTAVFVLGEVKGMKLVESLKNTEALLVDSNGKEIISSGFNKFLIKE